MLVRRILSGQRIFHHDDNRRSRKQVTAPHGLISPANVVIILCLSLRAFRVGARRNGKELLQDNKSMIITVGRRKILPQALLNFPISVICKELPCPDDVLYFSTASHIVDEKEFFEDWKQFPFDFLRLALAARRQ